MTRRVILVTYWLALVALSVTATSRSTQITSTSDLSEQHRATLERWLKGKPTLKLATESDCLNRNGLAASRQEYGRNYQPYYAAGDFNRDGRQDFAVGLVNQQQRSRKFAIAIFNGPFDQRRASSQTRASAPAFLADGIDLSEGGLFVRPGNLLLAGVFQSGDCVVLRPRGRTYIMKSCP